MTTDPRHPWRRLLRNRSAVCGMLVIAVCCFIAVFAYFIGVDGSPDANRIIVEIGGQKPGFRQQFLKLPRQVPAGRQSFIDILLHGRLERFDFIPVTGFAWKGDSLIASKYVDEGVTERIAFSRTGHPGMEVSDMRFVLGTDRFGRDILSRLLVGSRVSLGVGLVTVLLSVGIGVLLGAVAGYFRGRTDDAIMWLINVVWSIPTLLLVFAVTLVLGKGFWQVFVAIGLTTWVNVARLIRGQVLGVSRLEYIDAARVLGYSHARIILRHILPNVSGPVIVIAASNFATAIVIEAGLSFLGVGVQPPQPSWGLMIKENYNFIITHNPMLALAPGFAIMALVLAFNLLGNGLRDALQVRE